LLSGEGADEICGSYRYFRNAPDCVEFHWETIRLLGELYMFDNLRTDRTMAAFGLEVRVPYLDTDYVEFITRINPNFLMYSETLAESTTSIPTKLIQQGETLELIPQGETAMEKQIVRDSFKGYLPDEILYRSKEAFSDAVSNNETNWFKSVIEKATETISDADVDNNLFEFNKPKTSDALYFRRIFDEIYPGRDHIIQHYWLPRFQEEAVSDPSATVLKCY
jgi:asparagine synthase (glutamine-hydrolysing)